MDLVNLIIESEREKAAQLLDSGMLKRRAGAVTLFLTAALLAVVAIQSDQREAALFFWVLAALFAVSGLLSSRRPSWLTKWRSHV